MGKTENALLLDSVHEKNKSTSRLYSVSQKKKKKKTHTHTPHVSIVYMRKTKGTSRFHSVQENNKKYITFR